MLHLHDYFEWRLKGGFEPRHRFSSEHGSGDPFALSLLRDMEQELREE